MRTGHASTHTHTCNHAAERTACAAAQVSDTMCRSRIQILLPCNNAQQEADTSRANPNNDQILHPRQSGSACLEDDTVRNQIRSPLGERIYTRLYEDPSAPFFRFCTKHSKFFPTFLSLTLSTLLTLSLSSPTQRTHTHTHPHSHSQSQPCPLNNQPCAAHASHSHSPTSPRSARATSRLPVWTRSTVRCWP